MPTINPSGFMKYSLALAIGFLATVPVFADTNALNSVSSALAKLEVAPNYSWTVNIDVPNAPFTPEPVSGKTEKDGYSIVTQDFNGNTMEAVFKGEQVAVKGQDTWQSMADADDQTAMMAGFLVNRGTPTAEAEKVLKDAGDLTNADGGVISGPFTDAGATDMMTFPSRSGSTPPPPKDAKGTVKFWLNADGTLAKFESHLTAQVSFGDDQQQQDFEVTRTIEIHGVGTTKVEVPEDAVKALQAKAAPAK
jgi:hypothetical protein